MLDIIKSIINYVPRESIEEMLELKISSIVMVEPDIIPTWNVVPGNWNNIYGVSGNTEDSIPTIEMKVHQNQVKEENIKTSLFPEDILKTILDKFEEDYKEGKNYQKISDIDSKDINNYNIILSKIMMSGNIIAGNGRIGPGNVVIVPDVLRNMFSNHGNILNNMKLFFNPLSEYNDRIIVIRKDSDVVNQRYHLLTDNKIPGGRESKLNKLLGGGEREVNYGIVPIHGHKESIVVINIV